MPESTLESVLGPRRLAGPISAATRRLVEEMPKAELHLHLDGSLRIDTALELARTRGVDAPDTWAGMADLLIGPPRAIDQARLLRAFDLPIALLQDAEALGRASAELVAAKAADGVRYVEVRWGPLLHVRKGLALEAGIEAVVEAGRAAAAAAGVTIRFICTALRSHDPFDNVRLAEVAARFRDRGLLGWDLAGPEERYPDPHVHDRAFQVARAEGLRITLHAGEWGGAAQVRRALEMEPERIAHGPGAIDDPSLVAELVDRGVVLDLCPTSNAQASIVASVADHPLARLHRAGVPITLSTDDWTVSDVTLSAEYVRALERIGVTLPELWTIDRGALDAAFADETALAPLRSAFDAWAALVPEVAAHG